MYRTWSMGLGVVFVAACSVEPEPGPEAAPIAISAPISALNSCTAHADCNSPFNGSAVSCAGTTSCTTAADRVVCDGRTTLCQAAPAGPVCGNGVCEPGETTSSCAADCNLCAPFSDSYCDPSINCGLGSSFVHDGQYMQCGDGLIMFAFATPDCRWCIDRNVCSSHQGPVGCPI